MRNGKIARLAYNIREDLNLRMVNNEDGGAILDWLNALPAVRDAMKASFNGVPISKQNLCEWRQGGFREWQVRQELVDQACELANWSRDDLGACVDPPLLAGDMVNMVATRYAAFLNSWDGEADAKVDEKLRVLRGIARDLALVQRSMRRASKQSEEFHQKLEEKHQNSIKRTKQKILAPFWRIHRQRTLAAYFGGGEDGQKIAEYITAIENDLPLPESGSEKAAGQTQSNPVKPETAPAAEKAAG